MDQPVAPVAVVPGRRERKKLATRAAVREAALRLAVRYGVENVTVEQIAAEADVAERTFFNHFATKEDAVVAAAAAGADALVTEFRARPPGEPVLAAIREAVLVVMDRTDAFGRDHRAALRLMRDTPSLTPHQMAVLTAEEESLAGAIAERTDRGGLYPQLAAATALAALRIVLGRWLDHVGDADGAPPLDLLRAEVDDALSQLADGLGP